MAELLEELRPRAFAIAYRMLGSVSEAEDVVQEGLLRLHRAIDGGERIESPPAYLATVVTRLAIDELRSARARRETYVGEWLPEPLLTSEDDDPARQAEIADSLSLAFLVLLESLTPEQRAVLLLRDVFDYPYERIAEIVGKSESAVRQLAVRARGRVDELALGQEVGHHDVGGQVAGCARRGRLRVAVRSRQIDQARDGRLAAVSAAAAARAGLHRLDKGVAPLASEVADGVDSAGQVGDPLWARMGVGIGCARSQERDERDERAATHRRPRCAL